MLINQEFYRFKLQRAIDNYNKMRAEHLAGTVPQGDSAMKEIQQWSERQKQNNG